MKLEVRSSKRLGVTGLSIWGGVLASTVYALFRHLDLIPGFQCPWRWLLSIPCPFCGTTTTLRHVLTLDPWAAILTNPVITLLFLTAVIVALNELSAMVSKRKLVLTLSRREGWVLTALFLTLVAANWVYVLFLRGKVPVP